MEQCDISPYTLERALVKTYKYAIRNIGKRADLTQEKLNEYLEEMKSREVNVKRLIREFEDKEEIR